MVRYLDIYLAPDFELLLGKNVLFNVHLDFRFGFLFSPESSENFGDYAPISMFCIKLNLLCDPWWVLR